MIRKIL